MDDFLFTELLRSHELGVTGVVIITIQLTFEKCRIKNFYIPAAKDESK